MTKNPVLTYQAMGKLIEKQFKNSEDPVIKEQVANSRFYKNVNYDILHFTQLHLRLQQTAAVSFRIFESDI